MRRIGGPALLAALLAAGCSGETRPPNLLLVSVDTLRADRLACYGGPPDVGTALCGVAETGTRFDWAFATAPSTSPSVASLLTSQWVPQHRVSQNLATVLPDEAVTVAEALRGAGYTTAAFVSNPMLARRRRLDQGFVHYDASMTGRERNRGTYRERDAGSTTDAALAWAREQATPPWFLWVHFQDPHGPYDPPGAARPQDPPGARRLPIGTNNAGRGSVPRYQFLPGARAPETYAARYLDEIRFLDAELARLLDGLDALGEPPAVLVTADHGEAFGEDGYFFAHGHSVGLDQIRVPLLFRPPPGRAGLGVVTAPVSLVDVAPTLLALAGVAPPADFAGRPLPLAAGEAVPVRPIFAEATRQAAVIHGSDYYARDRTPGAPGRPDGGAWGDEDPPLPARTARLAAGPALPPYAPPGRAPALEPTLAEFLETHPVRAAATAAEAVPEELKEQVRALGYATD
jgi:arylsulfatase A-like enzyme